MDLDTLDTALAELALSRAGSYLPEFGQQWAWAASDEAPMRTGRLKRSIRWVDGPEAGTGYLELVYYGRFVQRGHATRRSGHRVPANRFLTRGAMAAYSPNRDVEAALRAAALAAITRLEAER